MLKKSFLILSLASVALSKAAPGQTLVPKTDFPKPEIPELGLEDLISRQVEEKARVWTKYGVKGAMQSLSEASEGVDGTTVKHFVDKNLRGAMEGLAEAAEDMDGTTARIWIDKNLEGVGQGFQGPGLQVFGNGLNEVVNVFAVPGMKVAAYGLTVFAAGLMLKYGIPLAFKMLEIQLMRPKLIIDSSAKTLWQSLFGKNTSKKEMIFSPNLEDKLHEIVQVTSTIHKKIKNGNTNVAYRNLMLYGPAGTGKTLFATELAKRCGLEYAFMSGSSFSKFKAGEDIEALDQLFAWANKSKGLLIFIDEAETFLQNRENMDPQSQAYLLLNNFLNYTGRRSNKFMIVFATNHKNNLDSAMYRRIDDLVEIPLPGKAERVRILNLYKDLILMDKKQNESLFVDSVIAVLTEDKIEIIAEQTKGLSAAELEGIMNAIKTSTDILEPAVITHHLVDRIVAEMVAKHFNFSGGSYLGTVEN
jgi:AAA+ superfamily predicted ATPase